MLHMSKSCDKVVFRPPTHQGTNRTRFEPVPPTPRCGGGRVDFQTWADMHSEDIDRIIRTIEMSLSVIVVPDHVLHMESGTLRREIGAYLYKAFDHDITT